jgi:hypothetical protein
VLKSSAFGDFQISQNLTEKKLKKKNAPGFYT